ncbi:MAG: hypothetical protein H0U75_08070 [Legionella sp.]|nr:hypothetical protein [Legionella sp.]
MLVAPIKTLLDLLCYGYQKIVTLLIGAGVFFAEKATLAEEYPPHNIDSIDWIDLKQRYFFEQFTMGMVSFFTLILSYLLFFLPRTITHNVGRAIGIFFTVTLVIPVYKTHFILNNVS